jgi:DNA-binding transcriptional LysR family regulator
MSYKLFKAFHAICITGSISKAADHLCLTQPAISIALRKLEKNHGVSLVTRHGPKIELTEEGKALQILVSNMFDAENSVNSFLQSGENLEIGQLTIASDGPVLPLELLRFFRAEYSAITVKIRFGNNIECWHALMRREVDIAFMARSGIPSEAKENVITHSIRKLGISAVLPEAHPLASKSKLRISELLEQPLLFREPGSNTQKFLDIRLSDFKRQIKPSAVLSTREAIINAVSMGLGIGFTLDNEAIGYRKVVSIPMDDLRDISEDLLVTLPSSFNRKIVQTAFNYIQTMNVALDCGQVH